MKTRSKLVPLILRFDWAIYLTVIAGFLCVMVSQISSASSIGETVDSTPNAAGMREAGLSAGAVYSIAIWIVLPLVAFVFFNVRASRKFRDRVAKSAVVPAVESKERVIKDEFEEVPRDSLSFP